LTKTEAFLTNESSKPIIVSMAIDSLEGTPAHSPISEQLALFLSDHVKNSPTIEINVVNLLFFAAIVLGARFAPQFFVDSLERYVSIIEKAPIQERVLEIYEVLRSMPVETRISSTPVAGHGDIAIYVFSAPNRPEYITRMTYSEYLELMKIIDNNKASQITKSMRYIFAKINSKAPSNARVITFPSLKSPQQ
jgi:hypothetical protein